MNFRKIGLVLVLAALTTGCGDSEYLVGAWEDFDQAQFHVSITNQNIMIAALKDHFQKKGHWTNNSFYCDSGLDAPPEIMVARDTGNDSLEVQMKYFDPNDTRVVTCTKIQRGFHELYPYPTSRTTGLVITYPPPKGLIKAGMLRADLDYLPWGSSTVQLLDNNPDGISRSDDAERIYHYRSDNPNVPELRVTVYKGRVTEVSGGNEDQPGPSWSDIHPVQTSIPSSRDTSGSNSSWTVWLFNLIFKK